MIVQERYEINGRQFIRTYSDAGRYVVGGNPEGQYAYANDPAEFNRQYTEGDLMPQDDEPTAGEILNIIMGGAE